MMRVICILLLVLLASSVASASEVIITSNALYSQANELKSFHEQMGIKSRIVTIEEISKLTEAEDPPVYGYANEKPSNIVNYNYSLAKKIIAFLRTVDAEYVTIFGDADIVPPSYYAKDSNFGFYPTDFFYMSPDYDLNPNFAVGRIPVSNASDAAKVVSKIKTWYSELNTGNYKNAVFVGTKIYATYSKNDRGTIEDYEVWQGELAVKHLADLGTVSKFNPKILLQSDYTASEIKPFLDEAFSGGYGLVYHSGHGTVTGIDMGGIVYTTVYLSKLSKKNPVLPVVVSDGCSSAGYDEEIMPSDFSTMLNWASAPKYPWAEYLLVSNAGGIAFVGFTRTTGSDYFFQINSGEVQVSGIKHAQAILTEFTKNLPGNTLGFALKTAMASYSPNVKLSQATKADDWALRVYLMATLIGDPTLRFPQLSNVEVNKPKFSVVGKYSELNGIPGFEGVVKFVFTENTTVKLFNLTNKSVPLVEVKRGVYEYTFNPVSEAKFLLRASNGLRETWYTFYAKPNSNSSTNNSTIIPLQINYPSSIEVKVAESFSVKIDANKEASCRITSAPSGVSCSNMIITWTPVKVGDYTINFEVSSGSETVSGKIVVKVKNATLKLLKPENFATNVSLSAELCANVDTYCSLEFYATNLLGTSSGKGDICIKANFEAGKSYEWFVKAKCGEEVYNSEIWTFTTTSLSSTLNETKTSVSLPAGSKDLDGDGLYEDINGDGVFDFNDVAYFQWNYNSADFQNYVQYYDFCRDGKIDTKDVLNLYVYWNYGIKRW